ncbi:hypothetical protein SSP35_08_00300 [Streptomyces sp. NBRC 110611]|uniref:DUF7848 domain-containing protein n=1 Tax=Streptomyces sp. NBRC 110611 TaxID=1621259 RepID=UPI00082C4BA3|nr:hypothetical protein [Streptomyces sp. NBRC 110611]GAU68536.1 hypothetical protein SSP35_08_00300 [Streptomyces sp. NBRC 110611]
MRARYRFLKWKLSAVPGMAARHLGKCLICGQHSVDTPDADDAQTWCLKHAGATRHGVYEVSAFQYFDAALTDPTAGGAPSMT